MNTSNPPPDPPRRPLPITITPGMQVFHLRDATAGVIAGMTQACCIYRLDGGNTLCVDNWRDLAIGGVCPAEPLLPRSVEENDRRNAAAAVLGALLGLQQLGSLTEAQESALRELISDLCGDS